MKTKREVAVIWNLQCSPTRQERFETFMQYLTAEGVAFLHDVETKESQDAFDTKLSYMFTLFATRCKQISKAVAMEQR